MKTQTLLVICFLPVILCTPAIGKIIYVDDDANGVNNGTSWENAYKYMQDALADAKNASKPVEIRIAQGIYKPDLGAGITHGDRNASFQMINKVSLAGGYAGQGQTDPNVRDIELYETILSGDLNSNDTPGANTRILYYEPSRAENSYHVITASYIDETTSIDGFTITAGNANSTSSNYQNGGGLYASYCDLTVSNCTFMENSAYQGGGLYNYYYNPKLVNCTFLENLAEYYGGGIYIYHGIPTLTDCVFNANVSGEYGAGMYNSYTNPMLENCIFNGNISENYGGGIYNDHSNPAITDCSFIVNIAESQGGAIYNQYSNPAFSSCTFLWNISESNGGGICNYQSSPILANCTFIENMADSYGGGIYNYNKSNSTLISCAFNGNSANYGGGMYIYSYSSPTITNCTFIENTAETYGGGIYNYSNSGNSAITGCTFSRNSAAYGGGIGNGSSGNATLTDCTFVENKAIHYGGGMYISSSTPTLTNCTFSGNSSDSDGGGMYNYSNGNPKIANCSFSKNLAKNYGAGIYNSSSNPKLTDCTLSENKSEKYGGGMYNYSNSNPVLFNCTISGNNAKSYGGGIYNAQTSISSIEKCLFCENTADYGGGMYNDLSKPRLINCIFSGNRAVTRSGALYSTNGSNIIAAACTFTGNLSPNGNTLSCFSGPIGRGGTATTSIIVLKNCIIWDENTQIWNNDGSAITISYCDVKDTQSASFDPLGKIVWGGGIIDNDPCFAYLGYWDPNGTKGNSNDDFWVDGDYHLKSQAGRFDPDSQSWLIDNVTSLCVDAGDPNNPVCYEPVPNGGRINMGAYGGTAEASKSLQEGVFFGQASNPYPADGAVNVLLDTMLIWTSDINAIVHEVYLGTGDQPPFVKKTLATEFTPEVLEPNTYYHWRIDDVDNSFNRITSDIWSFRTGSVSAHISNPYPANGAASVAISISLRWRPGSYADTYDVYFGTDFNDVNEAAITNDLGVLVSPGQDPNYYNPGMLSSNKMYFWRVDEKAGDGTIIKGHIWSFKTTAMPKRACFIGQTPAWVDGKAVSISTVCAGQYSSKIDKVEQLLIHEGTYTLYDILLESGDCITVADNHIFMTDAGSWCSLHDLKALMKLKTAKGSIQIKSVTKQPKLFTGKVYNLKIKGSDTYMVGKDAVIVRDY